MLCCKKKHVLMSLKWPRIRTNAVNFPIVAWWCNMALWVNTDSDNGTKTLPEPVWTYHHWDFMALAEVQLHRKCSRYQCMKWVCKCICKIAHHLWGSNELTHWPLGDLNVILKMQSSILLYWLVSSNLLMIMSSDECHRTLLMISQHWFR